MAKHNTSERRAYCRSGHRQHVALGPGRMSAPDYVALAVQIGELVTRNQVQYGRSFDKSGDVLRIFYPNGIQPDQYDDMMAITRIIDKQFRIANGSQGAESPYKDISGYGLLGWARTNTP